MILRRLALFIALLVGVGATQIPEFVQQYQQTLGGAIGELAADVQSFASDSAQQNLSVTAGIDRLRANSDPIAQARGAAMQQNVGRLASLRETQTELRTGGPVARLATVATHFDERIASEAWADFKPAVPVTPEAFVLGLLGFFIGGGAMHVAGRPFRRRRQQEPRAVEQAT